MGQSPQHNESRQSNCRASRGNVYQETDQELDISGEIPVATIQR